VAAAQRLVWFFDPTAIEGVRSLCLGIPSGWAYDRKVEITDHRVEGQVASVAASLEPRIAELASDIRDLIQRDIPTLGADPQLTSLLDASVEENVVTFVHMLRHSIVTAHVEASTGALEFARRLAQRDVPATDLIRAYRIGQTRFLRHCIDELVAQTQGDHVEGMSTRWMVEHVSDSLDRVIGQVLDAYESAREILPSCTGLTTSGRERSTARP